ncbi:DUF2243 domain-containing protein [Nocardia sp. NRRL S-836]|uniref:DUF2243 domain-containing protein n=1 Tax=Nocardia sp. NRRL S-836 TaxID=1519492 RepID=UPI0006AF8B8F|nr:DUF2243 domain-containing protein [Nocardia sp. NRRL S-836]KOV80846.1 hypothetical protein ADL03_31080 [Nocardia sp. NRRL S-836]
MLAAVVLGLGIGGFLDGIVIHQLLGWHHMLSGWYPASDMRLMMVGDGLFHLLCLVLVLVGVALLNRRAPLPDRVLLGGILAGWGAFNLVEGVIDHQVLGIHHVRPGPGQLGYDLAFLASGAALLAIGLVFARRSNRLAVGRDS